MGLAFASGVAIEPSGTPAESLANPRKLSRKRSKDISKALGAREEPLKRRFHLNRLRPMFRGVNVIIRREWPRKSALEMPRNASERITMFCRRLTTSDADREKKRRR